MNDLKFAFRQLLKNPGFTAVAVLTLALGIGTTAAIFSVVNAVLLRPLPFKHPERLMMIRETKLPQFSEFSVATGNFMEWIKQSTSFKRLIGMRPVTVNLADPGNPELLKGLGLTSGFCTLLGVQPQLGRDFLPDEAQLGRNNVVLLSHRLWQRRFGGDPRIVNQTIPIDGQNHTVIGVMPAGFLFVDRESELWTLIPLTAQDADNHGGHTLSRVIGQLKPGVSLDQARAELSAIERRLAAQFPSAQGWSVRVWPLLEFTVRGIKPALLMLLAAVGFVLLIACVNVANLLLARAATRRKEIAVRTALGAGRARIVRQLLTESVFLSLLGSTLGLVLAKWGTELLLRFTPVELPRLSSGIALDGGVLAFTGGLALLTGLLFGLAPALQTSKPNLNEVMNESGRSSTQGVQRHWVRSTLVVMEVASTLVLLVGAGLLLRSFGRVQRVDPGFRTDNVVTMKISLPKRKYSEDLQVIRFYDQLLEKVRAVPEVQAAGATSLVPISDDDFVIAFESENEPANPSGVISHTANFFAVSGAYFEAMGIPLLKGRYIDQGDTAKAPHVAVVNESLAKKLFPNQDPIGKRITFDDRSQKPDWHQIVGVVRDVKTYGLDQATTMQIYESFPQQVPRTMNLVVKTSGEPIGVSGAIRNAVLSLDEEQPVAAVVTLDRLLSASIAQRHFSMLLATVFAIAALLLAAVGTYGVLSYAVTQRTNEIGIRMALGARGRDVKCLLITQGMAMVLLGISLGLAGAFLLTRFMSSLLFGIRPTDPLTFSIALVVLTSVSFLACWLPARRAVKIDPMEALRYE